jgi:DNA-binding response OmpR family regulator
MSKKILIVDDDPDSLKLIELMLRRRGYDVFSAQSGDQALEMAKHEGPDLVILDVMMPGMDGHEVCRKLRADAQTTHLPVLMFTAKTLVGDKVAGFQAGADDYLTKPIHPTELVSHVEVLLQQSEQVRAAERVVPQARVIGVIGAKGGVGTSTLAVNLAVAACQRNELVRVSLADLRPGLGSVALQLGQAPQGGLSTLMSLNPDMLDQETVERQIVTHASGLRYLPASLQPENGQGHLLTEHVEALLNRLATVTGYLFLDLGSLLDEATRHALTRCDVVVVVVEPECLCLTLAERLLGELESLDPPPSNLYVVLVQRAESSAAYSQAEVENLLSHKLARIIPPAPDLARQATEQGIPIILAQPESAIARQLYDLSQQLLV